MFGSNQPRKRPGPPAEPVEIPHPWDEKTSPGPVWDEAPEKPIRIPPILPKGKNKPGRRGM